MKNEELYFKEHKMLREELQNLKECQIKFLTFSVMATGVLLGFAVNLSSNAFFGISYLFPLAILIPSWWIFFDKATKITGIVGYFRILEGAMLNRYNVKNFIGWENALAKFRKLQQEGKLKFDPKKGKKYPKCRLFKLVFLQTPHHYWVLTYYTFLGSSSLCVVMSFFSCANYIILSFATFIILFSAIWNALLIWKLIWGRNSYNANEDFWKSILKSVEKKKNP